MANKKPEVPSVATLPSDLSRYLRPIKENIDLLTGVRGGPIAQLPATAVLADAINKINELIARLNQAGQ